MANVNGSFIFKLIISKCIIVRLFVYMYNIYRNKHFSSLAHREVRIEFVNTISALHLAHKNTYIYIYIKSI